MGCAALGGGYAGRRETVAVGNGGQEGVGAGVCRRVVGFLLVNASIAVEANNVALGREMLGAVGDFNVNGRAIHFHIGHLRGNCAFADEAIELLLSVAAVDGVFVDIGRADSFVGFLGAFG